MYKFYFYVPESHCEIVKQAVFAAGAGKIGDYEHCAWQTEGTGQFRPLSGSHPFSGEQDKLASEREIKVEVVCDDELIAAAVAAMKQAHPYEEPAYGAWQLAKL